MPESSPEKLAVVSHWTGENVFVGSMGAVSEATARIWRELRAKMLN